MPNLLKAIDALREAGVRVLGAGAGDGERLDLVDFKQPTALVVGAEGKGMREAVARRCDGLFHIPQRGDGVVAERVGRRRHRPLRSRPPARVVDFRRNPNCPVADDGTMGMVMTKVTLWNNTDLDNAQRGLIRPEDVRTAEIEALVDTGATQMVIPIDVCLKLGLRRRSDGASAAG